MPFPLLLAVFAAQILDLKPAVQHATFAATANATAVKPGSAVSLWLDVTPKPKIHVYGPGAKGYLPIALTVTVPATATAGPPIYPKPEIVFFPALDERTPVYSRTFRLTQPLTISPRAKPGDVVTISGEVNYQACDDLICYPPSRAMVSWTIRITEDGGIG